MKLALSWQGSLTRYGCTDGDYKLTESLIIVEYLDKKYGKPENRLLPNDAAQHGKVNEHIPSSSFGMAGCSFES